MLMSRRNRVHGLLSDLFFGYEHPRFDAVRGDDAGAESSVDEERLELVADAMDFLRSYSDLFNCEIPSAEELADDMLA